MPPGFIADLTKALSAYPEPMTVEATRIPEMGVVAFVDEAIHHKTPTLRHREASVPTIKVALRKKYPTEFADADQAYQRYKKRWAPWPFSSYLKSVEAEDAPAWFKIMSKLDDKEARFNRVQLLDLFTPDVDEPEVDLLRAWRPRRRKSPHVDIDALVDTDVPRSGDVAPDFAMASVPYLKLVQGFERGVPVKQEGRPPLKRTMSQLLERGTAPKPAPGKRRFFRTWVRVVPRKK